MPMTPDRPQRQWLAAESERTRPSKGWALQLRCAAWLAVLCLIDATAPVMVVVIVATCALELWFQRKAGPPIWWSAAQHLLSRLQAPDPQFVLFFCIMLMNFVFSPLLLDWLSEPYMMNIMMLHGFILLWACLCTPQEQSAVAALHRMSTIFIAVIVGLLFLQVFVREATGQYLDLRLLLTGSASRSGVLEGSEGTRPTSLFAEPSNFAIVTFFLFIVNQATGPRKAWLSWAVIAACLLCRAGVALILAAAILLDELKFRCTVLALQQYGLRLISGLLLVGTLVVVTPAFDVANASFQQMINPETGYDPVEARKHVPERINAFSTREHLIGAGIANYASLPEGLTQYDSSFALGVYYQSGLLGALLMLLTLQRAWAHHSFRLMALLMVLFSTKMSLIIPAFWGISALLESHTVRQAQHSFAAPSGAAPPVRPTPPRPPPQPPPAPHAHRSHHSWLGHWWRGKRAAAAGPEFEPTRPHPQPYASPHQRRDIAAA